MAFPCPLFNPARIICGYPFLGISAFASCAFAGVSRHGLNRFSTRFLNGQNLRTLRRCVPSGMFAFLPASRLLEGLAQVLPFPTHFPEQTTCCVVRKPT